MKNFLNKIKDGLFVWIWILFLFWIANAWTWLQASPSDTLTASKWNELVWEVEAPWTIVQTVVKTSEVTSSLNTTTFTEANSDYRISFVPKYSNSKILVEYNFSANAAMVSNTLFHLQIVRDIWWVESLVWVWPVNWSRTRTTYAWRPWNWYDINDTNTIYMSGVDTGIIAWNTYTYWFKYKRETWGSWTMYFNYTNMDISPWFSWVMIMKITEIRQ